MQQHQLKRQPDAVFLRPDLGTGLCRTKRRSRPRRRIYLQWPPLIDRRSFSDPLRRLF